MKTKNVDSQIPRRNYIIYGLIVIFTVVLTLLFRNWYNINQDLKKKNTIMSEFLVSVNEEEFANYIMENNNVLIYLASSKNENLESFELELKKMLIEHNLQEQIVFVDLDQVENEFFTNLKDNYFSENLKNIKLSNFPNILIMENGKINAILYNKQTNINIDDVNQFFYDRGIIAQA